MFQEKSFVDIDNKEIPIKIYMMLILTAYLFSIAVRYIWVDWASAFPQYIYNGELMINTNDGYLWAEGARDILAGFHQPNDLSAINEPISKLTAFIVNITGIKFESVILWMSGIFGSLIVVPTMLIARVLKLDYVGIVAGLLVGIVWSYYNRTMIGYYDTDMLTIVLPLFTLLGLILSFQTKKDIYILFTAFSMLLYIWWYPSAKALNLGWVIIALLYTLVFERKDTQSYKIVLFLMVAQTPISIELRSVLIAILYIAFHYQQEITFKYIKHIFIFFTIAFIYFGGLESIINPIKGYIFHQSVIENSSSINLHFYAISKTVKEASSIPFELLAKRISGSEITFILSIIGYLMFIFRYRLMLLALPMAGLGLLAYVAGLRFTVYAVPVMALGIGYLIVWFAQRVSEYFKNGEQVVFYVVIIITTSFALIPNIIHIVNYKVSTVFNTQEVKVLDKLKNIAKREDYVLTWWDYGYPIRYYADVKTLIDGGKHTGDVNYPVSYALLKPQEQSALMARLATEYTEKSFDKERKDEPIIADMMRDYNITDPALFIQMVNENAITPPPKSRDIYYYLPLRMFNIMPTVALFSSIDLSSGNEKDAPFLYALRPKGKQGSKLIFTNGLIFDIKTGELKTPQGIQKLGIFALSSITSPNKPPKSEIIQYDPNSNIVMLFMRDYNRVYLMDRELFDSSYVQMFALGRYDKSLFEPVVIDPLVHIYRLKR